MGFMSGFLGALTRGGNGLGGLLAVWQQRAGRSRGVGRKGLMDGLGPIQSGPRSLVLPTGRPSWHDFCKYPGREFSRCVLFTNRRFDDE